VRGRRRPRCTKPLEPRSSRTGESGLRPAPGSRCPSRTWRTRCARCSSRTSS
jgi:hypothetical protein